MRSVTSDAILIVSRLYKRQLPMIHALEIGLALSVVTVVAALASLAARPGPVPVRVRANRTRRHPEA